MTADSRALAAVDEILTDWDQPDAPGIAVSVVRGGEPLYTRCFGLANVEHGVPNTTETVFDIASITKQFTALAVLLLVRDGKLGLDQDVRNLVPELPAYDPPVRVRHCLYHTSGLTDWLEALELAGPASDYCSSERAFRTITALRDTMFGAGEAHSYSNTGYVLLAWIIGRVAGKSMPDFLQERVFTPLHMTSAAFLSDPEDFLPNQAQGYVRDDDGRLYRASWPCNVCGDGRMFAGIADMTRWMQSFTPKGSADAELLESFFSPGRLDNGQPLRYAAGWEIDRVRGLEAFRHGGMGPGFQSHIAWFPEPAIGIAILGNLRPYRPWLQANDILDALLGGGPRQTTSEKPPSKLRDRGAADVSGRYFTAAGLPVRVDRDGDRIFIDIWFWRRPFAEQSPDVFREDETGDRVTFHRNAKGGVIQMTMATADGASPRLHSPIRRAERFESVALDSAALSAFEGRYISEALDTVYTLVAEDGGLTARHLRCFDWRLRPIKSCSAAAFGDDFAQETDWPGRVTFERNGNGDVAGFRVRGKRVNLFFRRLPASADLG